MKEVFNPYILDDYKFCSGIIPQKTTVKIPLATAPQGYQAIFS